MKRTTILQSVSVLVSTVLMAPTCRSFSTPSHHRNRFDADIASMEADVIWSLRSCETLDHIQDILEFAIWTNPELSSQHNSVPPPETRVGPNVAAAALHKTVDLFCRSSYSGETGDTMSLLLKNVGKAIVSAHNCSSAENTTSLTVYALSDVLLSLGKLSGGYNPKLRPLASQVCDLIKDQQKHYITTVGPKRLVKSLETLDSLRMLSERTEFIQKACNRLGCGDALGALSARDLSHILTICSKLEQPPNNTRAFVRRLRKQSVRNQATTEDLCRALVATEVLCANSTEYHDESRTMCYTLVRDLCSVDKAPLTPRQMIKVLDASLGLGFNTSEPILSQLCEAVCQEASPATLNDISRLLSCMQRLRLVHRPETVQRFGERFQQIVHQNRINTDTVGEILLCAALLHADNEAIMTPYVQGAQALFLSHPSIMESAFLSQCSCLELSRFLYFMTRTQWNDHEVLEAIGNQLLESEKCAVCSPKIARRILASFTTLVFRLKEQQQQKVELLLPDLFEKLGAHLWPIQFEPDEASSAMFAYAKASYVNDMVIFDALAGQVAMRLNECTVRQVAQSLWACGKMTVRKRKSAHYLECAQEFATFLSLQATTLSTKDVAQTVWACGRLRILEPSVIYPLAFRARELRSDFTSQEVANIMWGLSRVGYRDRDVVSQLTARIIHPSLKPTSQEATNVLYALGRMKICDRNMFSHLTAVLMGQLQDASAQSIANAMWSYKAVRLSPPKELIDSWAQQKLGLVGVVPPSEGSE